MKEKKTNEVPYISYILRKYSDLGKLADQLITCEIGSIEQCDNWLKMYRWFHDEMKSIVDANYPGPKKVKLHFWGMYFNLNGNDYYRSPDKFPLSFSFGIKICSLDNSVAYLNSGFRRVEKIADNYLSQYLYASALDYFVKQNFFENKQWKLECWDFKSTGLTNHDVVAEFGNALIETSSYKGIAENIIKTNSRKLSTVEMLQNLKDQIVFPETAFDKIAQNFEGKTKVLEVHK